MTFSRLVVLPIRLTAFVLLSSLAAAAAAQLRAIPAEAKRGRIEHVQDTIVAIDGKRYRLLPGAQIRSASNTFLVPMAIPKGAPARYLVDDAGNVRQVWILSPLELAGEGRENRATPPAAGE